MECFEKEAFTKRQIVQLLTDYNSVGLVARENDRILGFIIAMIYVDRNALSGHILTIDVSPAHRQKGIGQMLLQEIEKIFKTKGVKTSHLEVREDNVAAISLYTKLGYQKIGKLKNYYGNAHGIYLKKVLT
jgi:ribosomal-protein-alanine N-acetyltransferase